MAINLNGKKTSLKEDASIYEKRPEHSSEKEKLKSMNGRQKRSYFATYYLPPILVVLAVVAVIGYIVWTDFINKSNIYFRCAVLNESLTDSSLTEFSDSFTKSIGMDEEKNKASFYVYYTRSDLASEIGANAARDQSEITSRIVASNLGGMIADEKDGLSYYDSGFFLKLNDFLSAEEYKKLEKYLYIPVNEKNKEHAAYGVYLDKSPVYHALFKDQKARIERPIFSIITNADEESKAYAKKLIYYYFPDIFDTK